MLSRGKIEGLGKKVMLGSLTSAKAGSEKGSKSLNSHFLEGDNNMLAGDFSNLKLLLEGNPRAIVAQAVEEEASPPDVEEEASPPDVEEEAPPPPVDDAPPPVDDDAPPPVEPPEEEVAPPKVDEEVGDGKDKALSKTAADEIGKILDKEIKAGTSLNLDRNLKTKIKEELKKKKFADSPRENDAQIHLDNVKEIITDAMEAGKDKVRQQFGEAVTIANKAKFSETIKKEMEMLDPFTGEKLTDFQTWTDKLIEYEVYYQHESGFNFHASIGANFSWDRFKVSDKVARDDGYVSESDVPELRPVPDFGPAWSADDPIKTDSPAAALDLRFQLGAGFDNVFGKVSPIDLDLSFDYGHNEIKYGLNSPDPDLTGLGAARFTTTNHDFLFGIALDPINLVSPSLTNMFSLKLITEHGLRITNIDGNDEMFNFGDIDRPASDAIDDFSIYHYVWSLGAKIESGRISNARFMTDPSGQGVFPRLSLVAKVLGNLDTKRTTDEGDDGSIYELQLKQLSFYLGAELLFQ